MNERLKLRGIRRHTRTQHSHTHTYMEKSTKMMLLVSAQHTCMQIADYVCTYTHDVCIHYTTIIASSLSYRVCVQVHACIHKDIHACIHTCIHTCIHDVDTYIRMYTRIDIHTYPRHPIISAHTINPDNHRKRQLRLAHVLVQHIPQTHRRPNGPRGLACCSWRRRIVQFYDSAFLNHAPGTRPVGARSMVVRHFDPVLHDDVWSLRGSRPQYVVFPAHSESGAYQLAAYASAMR